MKTLILIALIAFKINITPAPSNVVGKWKVTATDASHLSIDLTEKEKPMFLSMMKQVFTNAVFDLQANHRCNVTVKMPNMPQNLAWKYDAATGYLLIHEAGNPASKIFAIDVKQQNGQTYFGVRETGLVLKMQKL